MPDVDVARRMKILRAVGAASLDRAGRAASLTTATGLEAANFLLHDKRGRLVLGTAALALFVLNHPQMIGDLQMWLQNAGVPQLPSIDVAGFHLFGAESVAVPGAETVSAAAPPVSGVETNIPMGGHEAVTGVAPGHTEVSVVSSLPPTDVASQHAAPAFSGAEAGASPAPSVPTEGTTIPVPGGEVVNAGEIPQTIWSQIQSGQPIEPQVRSLASQLPGNPTENYYNLLSEVFKRNISNFTSTAQAMLDAPPGTYTLPQLQLAREQVDAIARIQQNPTIDASTIRGYADLTKAMHFWRPM